MCLFYPLFCFSPSDTPIIRMLFLLCLFSISIIFSLTIFTSISSLFSFSWLFSCLVPLFSSKMTNFHIFLVFQDLDTLKSSGELFCRMSLNFGLLDLFPWLEWVYVFLERTPQKWWCAFLSASFQVTLDNTGEVLLVTWLR